jgi:hypothetical protein
VSEESRGTLIRRKLEEEYPLLRTTPEEEYPYLTFELRWRPVLTALGVRHEDFQAVCYTQRSAPSATATGGRYSAYGMKASPTMCHFGELVQTAMGMGRRCYSGDAAETL